MSREVWGDPDDYECPNCLKLIEERDAAKEAADKLAQYIAEMLRVDIGEHTNSNDLWKRAAESAESFLRFRKRNVC